ncbi:MAG: serine hydroxymethyltransferase, partial [Bacteriovoracaceae bacterium]|nr:serine hydroxymethyltransferase [Bacteriovoracaceae bacterium]
PRGGLILTNDEDIAKKIDFNVFPGMQGGPLEHVIAAKAVAFKEALDPSFKTYQEQVIKNATALAEALKTEGIDLVSGGTDNHLILIKTDSVELSGKKSEKALEAAGITTNKNMIPNDSRSPFITSGVRIGTPAVTTRGLREEHMSTLAGWIAKALRNNKDELVLAEIKSEVVALCKEFPVYR